MEILNRFSMFSIYIIIFLLLIIFAMIVTHFVNINKMKELRKREIITDEILNSIKTSNNLDDSLMGLLSTLAPIVHAPSYAFYVREDKNGSYILKGARNMMEGDLSIKPSYSGLLPYKKEKFIMPAVIDDEKVPEKIDLFTQGEVPLIIIPLENKRGLILIGPITRISSIELKGLQQLSLKISGVLEIILEKEESKNKIKKIVSSRNAVKNISNVFSDLNEMMEILLDIAVKSINASGGLFVSEKDNGEFHVEKIIGLEAQQEELFLKDTQIQSLFFSFLLGKEMILLTKKDVDFYKIPPYFVSEGIQQILIVKVNSDKGIGCQFFGIQIAYLLRIIK